jgi:hypothetical protein
VLLKAVFTSAQELNVPVLLGASDGEREFMGVRQIAAWVRSLRDEFNFPIFLNANHTHSLAKAADQSRDPGRGRDRRHVEIFVIGSRPAVQSKQNACRALDLSDSLMAKGFVLKFRIVAQFVIEREIPDAGTLSDTQIREISLRSLQALEAMGPQIQWLHSYVTEDKVYCVYLAPDEDTIREHARLAGIPADRVSAVRRLIDPANLN